MSVSSFFLLLPIYFANFCQSNAISELNTENWILKESKEFAKQISVQSTKVLFYKLKTWKHINNEFLH